jgi:hypothetical protein
MERLGYSVFDVNGKVVEENISLVFELLKIFDKGFLTIGMRSP